MRLTIGGSAAAMRKGKWFVGGIMNHHGNKKGNWTACAKVVAGTHQSVLCGFPSSDLASMSKVRRRRPCPPAHVQWKEWWWKTLCPGLDTHTHTPTDHSRQSFHSQLAPVIFKYADKVCADQTSPRPATSSSILRGTARRCSKVKSAWSSFSIWLCHCGGPP